MLYGQDCQYLPRVARSPHAEVMASDGQLGMGTGPAEVIGASESLGATRVLALDGQGFAIAFAACRR